MGYSGQPMRVIKANRALLKKSRSFKELRKDYIKFSGDTKVEFKELSEFEKKKIRDKIKAQFKEDKKQGIILSVVCFGLTVLSIYFIYLWVVY